MGINFRIPILWGKHWVFAGFGVQYLTVPDMYYIYMNIGSAEINYQN